MKIIFVFFKRCCNSASLFTNPMSDDFFAYNTFEMLTSS